MVILKTLDPNYKGEDNCEGGTCAVIRQEVEEDTQEEE